MYVNLRFTLEVTLWVKEAFLQLFFKKEMLNLTLLEFPVIF